MSPTVTSLDQLDYDISVAYIALGVARGSYDRCPSAENERARNFVLRSSSSTVPQASGPAGRGGAGTPPGRPPPASVGAGPASVTPASTGAPSSAASSRKRGRPPGAWDGCGGASVGARWTTGAGRR